MEVGSVERPEEGLGLAKGSEEVLDSSLSEDSAASSSSSCADWSRRLRGDLCLLKRGGRLKILLVRIGFGSSEDEEEVEEELRSSAAEGELGLEGLLGVVPVCALITTGEGLRGGGKAERKER